METLKHLCVIAVITACVRANDREASAGDITTKVMGQSGKIAVYWTGMNESDGVTIAFDSLKTIDSNGTVIDGYDSFASLNFTFSNLQNTTYEGANLSVVYFTFKADIPYRNGTASLTTAVYIFKESGHITVGGENYSVSAGVMKFNVEMANWTFCESCNNGSKGDSLDFDIEIKGKKSPNKTMGNHTYDFGDGTIVVPSAVSFYFDIKHRFNRCISLIPVLWLLVRRH